MARLDRRGFLRGAVATTGGVLVAGSVPALLADAVGATPPDGFRGLGPVPDLRDGRVRLHLPPGFQYRSFHDTDTAAPASPPHPEQDPLPPVVLADGTVLPGRHDGMAAFPGPDGNVWLVRNHEQNGNRVGGAFGPGTPYDGAALGGTTTVLVTPFGEVLDDFTSLNGTMMNCAGGAMPWGSWITCEETVNGPDVGPDFTRASNVALEQPHGFIFEVPVGEQSDRVPVRNAGRFAHEAAAYSPIDGHVYLTEDNFAFPSGFYRYLPPSDPMVVGRLEDGGRLQMLKVAGVSEAHLEAHQAVGSSYPVEWVDIEEPWRTYPSTPGEPAPTANDAALTHVGDQGRALGAAHFSRLEGATVARGEIWFTSTQGGGPAETGPELVAGYGNGTGQVWSYDPAAMVLTCRYQAPSASVLDFPDNITARSDRGTLVLCEDGAAPNYIRGLGRDGQLFDIALNRLHDNFETVPVPPQPAGPPRFASRYGEEFAGATFGPGTDTLYVNIQASKAISFAIWGPWGRIGV